MLRLIGAVIVVACTGTFGVSCAMRLGLRARVLSELIAALEVMRSEICDRLTPMPDLLETLAEQTNPPVSRMFAGCLEGMKSLGNRSFYFLWKTAVEQTPELELTRQESQTLIELGHVLGRYDVEEQRRSLNGVIRRLEGYLKHAQEEKRVQTKAHAALGVAAGFFVVIILI